MDELLTTHQIQAILKVDRITVYRMLQDGRLRGIKIGQQWRFPRAEVDRLLSNQPQAAEPLQIQTGGFPTHCVQTIQDLFSDVARVGAQVIDTQGELLTQPSNVCEFCRLLWQSPDALRACQTSWKAFIEQSRSGSLHFTCESGLQYVGAPIFDRDVQVGLFLAGPFYWQRPNPNEESGRIQRMATTYKLPAEALMQAAHTVPVISHEEQSRVEAWPFSAARAIQSILHERTGFMNRLQQIANLTQVA